MNDYALLLPSIAFGLLAVVCALLWLRAANGLRCEQRISHAANLRLRTREKELALIESQLADAKDMIADRDAQIVAWHQMTTEMPQVEITMPQEEAKPRRTTRTKKANNDAGA